MPLFDVVCPKCKAEREVLCSNSESLENDPPLCDECKTPMDRSFSSNMTFRINGYCYNNEYNKKSMYKDLKPK